MRHLKNRHAIVLSLALGLLAIFPATGLADLYNGSFETGDLTGWSTYTTGGGSATVVTSHSDLSGTGTTSWAPTDGTYFALVKTDGQNSFQQLYRSFTASAGDILTLDYFWDSQDTLRGTKLKDGDDVTYGIIFSGELTTPGNAMPSLTVEHELFHHAVSLDPQAYWGTDWTSVTYTFEEPGTYTLWFGIKTGGDSLNDSRIGIDNVHLVPLPAAALLGVLGLGVAGWRLRRFV